MNKNISKKTFVLKNMRKLKTNDRFKNLMIFKKLERTMLIKKYFKNKSELSVRMYQIADSCDFITKQ